MQPRTSCSDGFFFLCWNGMKMGLGKKDKTSPVVRLWETLTASSDDAKENLLR